MLCIFNGRPASGLDAGKIQDLIKAQVGLCEHDPAIQHRKEGCFHLRLAAQKTPGQKFTLPGGTEIESIEPYRSFRWHQPH